MTLTELAEKWSVDKLHRHSYIPHYARLFEPFRNGFISICEFGIGYESLMKPFVPVFHPAASLRMWAEFMPNADIYAADHHESTLVNEGRIRSYLCDQSRRADLLALSLRLPPLQIFIDDGSHQLPHQILTAAVMLERVGNPGLYVIEDVYRDSGQLLADMFGGELICGRKTPDDNLVVIRR